MKGLWSRHTRSRVFDTSVLHPVSGAVGGLVLLAVLVPVLQVLHGASGPLGPSLPLFFLVPVLLTAAVGGRVAGLVVAAVAVFVWDWFFIPPFYTVTIYYPRDVLALIVFFAVALLTDQLATTVRRRADEALSRAAIAEALYDLSTALIAQHDLSSILSALTERLRTAFDLESCAVLLPERAGGTLKTAAVAGNLPPSLRVDSNRTLHGMASWVNAQGQSAGLAEQNIRFLPLRAATRSVGVLQLVSRAGTHLDPERERLLLTFANGAAIAVEQARLADEERTAALAIENDRLKSGLLSSVSHDLRTPLAGIKAAASSLLQTDVEWSEENRQAFAADIDSEADRLTRLVSNLLDLSRIEAGAITPHKEWEDVCDLINRVVRRLEPQLSGHPVSIDVPSPLPLIPLDAVQIEQVLTNLVENAAKYSLPGAPIVVRAAMTEQPGGGQEAHISVTDQGPGIEPRDQQRVFDKFYRVARPRIRTSGTGMGLAIVKGLVEANGGRVWVESTPGEGSTFAFVLPSTETPPEEQTVTPAAAGDTAL